MDDLLLDGGAPDVAAIGTIEDGLAVRAEFYAERQQAFDVAGLQRGGVPRGAARVHDEPT